MKEKNHEPSDQRDQRENLPEVHSIRDVCSMKEKKRETSFCGFDPHGHEKKDDFKQVTNVTNRVVFGKSVLTQGCERGVTNERKKTPSVNRDRIAA